jgi:hypothetical protein
LFNDYLLLLNNIKADIIDQTYPNVLQSSMSIEDPIYLVILILISILYKISKLFKHSNRFHILKIKSFFKYLLSFIGCFCIAEKVDSTILHKNSDNIISNNQLQFNSFEDYLTNYLSSSDEV